VLILCGFGAPTRSKYGKSHKSEGIIVPILKIVPLNSTDLELKLGSIANFGADGTPASM